MLDVWTGDIQLDGMDMLQFAHTSGAFGIVLRTVARHVHHHLGGQRLHLGIDMSAEVIHALVLQPHAVEHPLRRFGHTGIGVALAWMQGGTLHDNASQLTEVNQVGVLEAVTKRAAGGHHGILERETAYMCCQICHFNFSISNTGPSLHTHT